MFKPSRNSINLLKKPKSFLGIPKEKWIQVFFFGNAWVAILVLLLIAFFLFKEGASFFGMHRENQALYRRAGLEYVEAIKTTQSDLQAITKFVNDTWIRQVNRLRDQGVSYEDANERCRPLRDYAENLVQLSLPLNELSQDLTELVTFARDTYLANENMRKYRETLIELGETEEADAIEIDNIDFAMIETFLEEQTPVFASIAKTLTAEMLALKNTFPTEGLENAQTVQARWNEQLTEFQKSLETQYTLVTQWDPDKKIGWFQTFSAFMFGKRWVTNSFWQDWYGILPLLSGSLLISGIALTIAVPVGVMAAIYVNQLAGSVERSWIKPSIEFISAIPSVVLGFFGIAVLGEIIRQLSNLSWLEAIPIFPIAERLNAFTAGCLLAIMAIPTIFTLAEDALNSVPRSYRNASYAVGATRLQTILHIVIPTALPGITSAILLGFGRVIGETMVVLLCAGNRIAIPQFSEGIGVIFEPVHTMTGIIAQEMGEVALGSIHYRALFMLGIFLFCITLGVNWIAQKIVRRFRIAMFTT
jgi:phosphate transport system permease protein